MKLYKREDFIKLPAGTIYSRVTNDYELMNGLFCKDSGIELQYDWSEQDLIAEPGFPNDIREGSEAIEYQLNLRNTFQEFETDLECSGRDGLYEDENLFVVWSEKDVTKLITYLQNTLNRI